MKQLFIFIILSIFTSSLCYSQELEHQAPTLQVGLNDLNFTKGTLDPEVIASIIAEKQREIKIKVIQNSFLSKLYGSGGTIYNYADNVIKGVVEEPDTDIRTRKIMESTVNLVFVYAFADFYLKKSSEDSIRYKNLQKLASNVYNLGICDFKNGLSFNKLKGECKTDSNNDDMTKFISLLIDMSSEVVRHDDKLQSLGLMRISYSSSYEYLNLYNLHQGHRYSSKNRELKGHYIKDNRIYVDSVYTNMRDFLKTYTNHIGALKYMLDNKNFKSNNVSFRAFETMTENVNDNENFEYIIQNRNTQETINFNSTIGRITSSIDSLSKMYNTASLNNKNLRENYFKSLETAIDKLNASNNYFKRIQSYLDYQGEGMTESEFIADKAYMISDILYSLKFEVIPNIEYSIKYVPDLIQSRDFVTSLSKDLYSEFINIEDNSISDSLNKDPEPFLNLVSKLYEFDKTKTFSEYVNLISLLDEVFTTGNFKSALSTINTFVKDYTEITKDSDGNEVLIFNVESFLVKLEGLQSNKINRVQFHFTVGMNTTTFVNGNIDLGNGESISNFSHFSEKIGLKYKIVNRGDWIPRDPGDKYKNVFGTFVKTSAPREPVVSNWHILLYGSGLLYTVINSSTNTEFDYPMAGFGTGLTFFNDLDFNVSIGIPILENGGFEAMTDNYFLSFGFDIQIAEYLKGVAKKRRERKRNEKVLSSK